MGLIESVSKAQVSGNLGEGKPGQLADVDVIRACGMVSAKNPLGMSLWRIKYSDVWDEVKGALDGLTELLVSRRKMPKDAARQSAERVLAHWIGDRCDECGGTGYATIPGTPMLSDVACPTCKGQGRVELDNPTPDEKWLQSQVALFESEVAGAIMTKLRDDF